MVPSEYASSEEMQRARQLAGTLPDYAQHWLLGDSMTYPTGRGQEQLTSGWKCPGCTRCYSPAVRECPFCQPLAHAPQAPHEAGAACDCCPED